MINSQHIAAACQEHLVGANLHACNFFVRDVTAALGAIDFNHLDVMANVQIDRLRTAPNWQEIGHGDDGARAALIRANAGELVVAGWKNPIGHGHVAIAVWGTAINGWPHGYWGRLDGAPGFNSGLRNTFGTEKRPSTVFFARPL